MLRYSFLMVSFVLAAEAFSGDAPGTNLIELKLTLPKGDTYMRGGSDPVADLTADVTLTNKSPKENLVTKTTAVNVVLPLTADEVAKLKTMSFQHSGIRSLEFT